MTKTTKKAETLVAEIALYGTQAVGAGWLARTADGRMFGTGEPNVRHNFTSAVWAACDALRAAGCQGLVRIFEPKGQLMSTVSLGGLVDRRIPYFGDLKWSPAPVYTINLEALEVEVVR